MRKYLGWMITCVVIALSLTYQWWRSTRPVTVQVVEVQVAPLMAEWSAVGYVEAHTARITTPHVGRIERVLVREGDRVRGGQLLATLVRRSEEAGLVAQQAGVRLTLAQVEAAQAALHEAEAAQSEREKRAAADTAMARERWLQAVAMWQRSRKALPARLDAARSERDAAQAALRDLEQGNRPEEIAQAQEELRAAEATLTRARAELARQTRLVEEGAAPRTAIEDAQEALTRAEAAVNARREAVKLWKRGAREEQIAAARARLRAAEANLQVAQSDLAALDAEARKVDEALAALKAARAAEAEVRAGRKRLETLRQEVRAAMARVGQSRANMDQAREQLRERAVYAPFDGIIGRRFVDPGDMASPSQVLFSVVERGNIWVTAEVDEQDLAPVREGQRVVITVPAYTGREFVGLVTRIGGEAMPQTEVRTGARIVRVRISLQDTPSEARVLLKPGMEVHASGRSLLAPRALLVSSDAILTDDDGQYVWVIEGDRVRRRRVRTGYVNGPVTEVLEGVKPGDRVVVAGKEGLAEGQRVEAKPALDRM